MYPSPAVASSNSSSLLSSPFLSPYPLRLSPSSLSLPNRRRLRVSLARSASLSSSAQPPEEFDVFGRKRELSGIQVLVDSLAPPVRLAASAVVLAGAVTAGYWIGLKFGGNRNLALGGAAVAGVAGGAAVFSLNSQVPEVAAAALHNFASGIDDPKDFKKEDVENIAKMYGISKQDATFKAELSTIYRRFLSSVLPPGGEDLKGNEVETILNFKNSLGIDDTDAAAMHMEIGRWIFRQRLETGDRDGDVGQRRAFQKLIYVSTLVFGEASSFLLPWKRVFKITDSQVAIAVRDNAQRLYASKLKSVGTEIGAEQLVGLRQSQLRYKLSDELAEDLFRQHTRKLVEQIVSSAVKTLKLRQNEGNGVKIVEELDKVLAFNNKLISLKSHANAASFARGVGPVSLVGGEYADEREMNDLKLLYSAYASDTLSGGRMNENKLATFNQLRDIFGLGRREAEKIVLDIASKVYRKRLSQSVSDGDLVSADSKAAFLQDLCEELHFDPEQAIKVHEEIYRQKLEQCASDRELSEEDLAALNRLRICLCIPQQTIDAAHSDICGSLFEKVISNAIASGVNGYDELRRKEVRKAVRGLRLTREAVMSTAGKAVRRLFVQYIKRAQSAGKRSKAAEELQEMVAFNSTVVTQLLADIKGVYSEEPSEEPAEESKAVENDEEWDKNWESLTTLKKLKASVEDSELRVPVQAEINLKDELPLEDRMYMYEAYLQYCQDGAKKKIGFGIEAPVGDKGDYSCLYQLGQIFGLTAKETVKLHRMLAVKMFKEKAGEILADGELTKTQIEQLTVELDKLGLPSDIAEGLVSQIKSCEMAAGLEAKISKGELSLKQVRELKAADVKLETMVSEKLRESLFKKTVDEILSSGTGEFDEEEIYHQIPSELIINAEKARGVARELAQYRLSSSLIQSISLLRQRKYPGVVSTLNNLLACDKASPSEPLSWNSPREMSELYMHYLKSGAEPEKLSRLQYLLGLSDAAAEAVREAHGALRPVEAEAENFVF